MKRSGTIAVFVLLILVVIALAGAGYYFYTQKSPTTSGEPVASVAPIVIVPNTQVDGWATYTNSSLQFTVQYPANLKTQVPGSEKGLEEASSTSTNFYVYDPARPMTPAPYLYLTVNTLQEEPEYGEEWLKTPFTIGKQVGTKITIKEGTTDSDIYQFRQPSGGIVEIRVTTEPDRSDLAEQIFKTFKFTN